MKIRLSAIVLMVFFAAGCGRTSLSKAKALDLIQSSSEFQEQPAQVILTPDALDKGLQTGYWTETDQLSSVILTLTPKGSQYFSHIGNQYEKFALVTAKPLKPYVVDVISIVYSTETARSSSPIAVVRFKWDFRWEGFPDDLRDMFNRSFPATGVESFRYADGQWRSLGPFTPVQ